MSLPLINIQCSCKHEQKCQNFGIPQDILKGLIYLMGAHESKDFAMTLAARKLRRKNVSADEFTMFVDTVKESCPYYRHLAV